MVDCHVQKDSVYNLEFNKFFFFFFLNHPSTTTVTLEIALTGHFQLHVAESCRTNVPEEDHMKHLPLLEMTNTGGCDLQQGRTIFGFQVKNESVRCEHVGSRVAVIREFGHTPLLDSHRVLSDSEVQPRWSVSVHAVNHLICPTTNPPHPPSIMDVNPKISHVELWPSCH